MRSRGAHTPGAHHSGSPTRAHAHSPVARPCTNTTTLDGSAARCAQQPAAEHGLGGIAADGRFVGCAARAAMGCLECGVCASACRKQPQLQPGAHGPARLADAGAQRWVRCGAARSVAWLRGQRRSTQYSTKCARSVTAHPTHQCGPAGSAAPSTRATEMRADRWWSAASAECAAATASAPTAVQLGAAPSQRYASCARPAHSAAQQRRAACTCQQPAVRSESCVRRSAKRTDHGAGWWPLAASMYHATYCHQPQPASVAARSSAASACTRAAARAYSTTGASC